MNKFSIIILPILFVTIFLIIWQIACITFKIHTYLLPKPTEIIQALFINKKVFFKASLVTLSVTLISVIISAFLGSLISICLYFSKTIDKSISPFLIILQITPIVAIIPILIIWFKSKTIITLIICSIICSIFPIISSMSTGLKSVEKSLAMIFDIYNATKYQKLFKLYLPSALPYFLNGVQIASALALIGCISAEFIAGTGGRDSGIAYQLLMAGYNLQTDKLFAALFLITFLGVIIHFLFKFIKSSLLKNY